MTTTHPPAHAPVSHEIVERLKDFRLALEQQRQFRLEQLDELAAASAHSLAATEATDEVRNILRASATAALTEVEAALGRLHAGLYGICGRCAKAISKERLEVLPMSRHCMSCQRSLQTERWRNTYHFQTPTTSSGIDVILSSPADAVAIPLLDRGEIMSDTAAQGNAQNPPTQDAGTASLQDEHALLMRDVRLRAQAVISNADEGRWPESELHELLNYLHLEILRQVVEEEWLLFRLIRHASDELARMRREHLELRLAIEELDQAAATAGGAKGLSASQLSAITRDLLAQLEAHFAAEDELAIMGRAAPATATLGAQPHEWYALTAGPVIDLDELQGQHGADAALARLRRLDPSEQVEIRSSGDPSPLCHRLTAVDPGGYGITYLERGPDRWRVEIVRRPEQTALRPYA